MVVDGIPSRRLPEAGISRPMIEIFHDEDCSAARMRYDLPEMTETEFQQWMTADGFPTD